MRQGGSPLTDAELKVVMDKIEAGKNGGHLFYGLQGIDASNTAPYFDDALEALVQQYGLWALRYDVDMEYNRRDLRDEAIRRALWAILVVNGYIPYGENSDGDWSGYDDETFSDRSLKRSEAWDIINNDD